MATLTESKSVRKYSTTGAPTPQTKLLMVPAESEEPAAAAASIQSADLYCTDQELHFQNIDKLQDCGINASDINKLRVGGYCTVLSIVQATKKDLCQVKGLSEAKVEKIVEAAAKIEVANNFITGVELVQRRAKIVKITTGSEQLDQLLGGGIESMAITELFGENRCGKTQLCHTLCVTSQLPKELKGGCGKVCFIDTEGTFRPEKIHKIAERYELDGEKVLDNIMYARAYTTEHIVQLLTVAAAKMCEEPFAILIIDSIISLFRVDFIGRGELADRQQKLNKTLSGITKLADQFNIAVLITNQVMSDPGATLSFVANPTKPVGGHILGHASTIRLSLRKGKGNQRICKVYDAPNLPENEAVFALSDGGVCDPMD